MILDFKRAQINNYPGRVYHVSIPILNDQGWVEDFLIAQTMTEEEYHEADEAYITDKALVVKLFELRGMEVDLSEMEDNLG